MPKSPAHSREANPPSLSVQFGQALRRYFVTGLATLFPVAVTLWLLVVIFNIADRTLGRLLGFKIPGLGLVVTLLVILLVGVFSIHFFGRVVFQAIEVGLARLPIVRKIYPAVKQLTRFLFGEHEGQKTILRVVLVEYPRPGSYSIAFVTNESYTSVTGTSRRLLTLMIPTPPSPLTGPIIFVPEEDTTPIELTVEDAFKLVMSGGVVASPLQAAGHLPAPPVGGAQAGPHQSRSGS